MPRQIKGFKTWRVTLEITVADTWVADGFDLDTRADVEEDFENFYLAHRLGWATSDERSVKCVKLEGPSLASVRKLQGYDVEAR